MIYGISRINNFEGLSRALQNCKGKVELHTSEGDRLNLKSEFTRLLTLQAIMSRSFYLKNVDFYIENPADAQIILQYVVASRRRPATVRLEESYS